MPPVDEDDAARRRRLDEERERWEQEEWWAAQEAAEQEEAERIQRARREAAVDEMVDWFHTNFEDPQVETPYDSEEGRFVYPWGGPFDAAEMLHNTFDEYPEEWVNEAVENVQGGEVYEWAPTSHGDFYERPDDDEPEKAQRTLLERRILDGLSDLERQLHELPTNYGHNGPPDEVGVPPYTDDDRQTLIKIVVISRAEVGSPEPSLEKLAEAESKFADVAAKVGKWLGRKADLAVDQAIKYGVPLLAFAQFYETLQKLAGQIAAYLNLLAG